jgi:hypothetical protein
MLPNGNNRVIGCCFEGTSTLPGFNMSGRSGKSRSSVRLCITLLVTVGLSAFVLAPASADDQGWMFRRSYFSHILPPEVQARYPIPVSRSAYRLPLVDTYPGFAVQGIQRWNTIQFDHGTDTTIYRQFWIQAKP